MFTFSIFEDTSDVVELIVSVLTVTPSYSECLMDIQWQWQIMLISLQHGSRRPGHVRITSTMIPL